MRSARGSSNGRSSRTSSMPLHDVSRSACRRASTRSARAASLSARTPASVSALTVPQNSTSVRSSSAMRVVHAAARATRASLVTRKRRGVLGIDGTSHHNDSRMIVPRFRRGLLFLVAAAALAAAVVLLHEPLHDAVNAVLDWAAGRGPWTGVILAALWVP